MSKTFTTSIGGKDREFRYTSADRDSLEDTFDMGLLELIQTKVLPRDANGRATGGGVLKAQRMLVFKGLQHNGQAVTERKVGEWFDQEIEATGNLFEVLNLAVSAVLASGVLGRKVSFEDETDPKEQGAETPAS